MRERETGQLEQGETEREREQGRLFEFETGQTVSLASEALTSRSNAASQWEKDVPRDIPRGFDNASRAISLRQLSPRPAWIHGERAR